MDDIGQEIIEQAINGDQQAFADIYRGCSGFVYNVALRVSQAPADAQEVTQEVFLTIYRKLHTFRFQSRFKTWVYRITVNTAINYAKKHARDRHQSLEYDEHQGAGAQRPGIERMAEQEHANALVDQLLARLSPDHRACIVLRNIEGLSYEQMAGTLGININTVRSRLKRAREALMKVKSEVMTNGV